MKQIIKNKRMRFLTFGAILVSIFTLGVFIQGCNSEEDVAIEKSKNIANSKEFQDFTTDFSEYQKKIFISINSLTEEEKENLYKNRNNDEMLMSFLEKNDLIDGNLFLQTSIYNFKNKTTISDLTTDEQLKLFTNNSLKKLKSNKKNPRLKSNTEIGMEPCLAKRLERGAYLEGMAYLKTIACFTAVHPAAIAICTAAVLVEYYYELDQADKAYEDCLSKK